MVSQSYPSITYHLHTHFIEFISYDFGKYAPVRVFICDVHIIRCYYYYLFFRSNNIGPYNHTTIHHFKQ